MKFWTVSDPMRSCSGQSRYTVSGGASVPSIGGIVIDMYRPTPRSVSPTISSMYGSAENEFLPVMNDVKESQAFLRVSST